MFREMWILKSQCDYNFKASVRQPKLFNMLKMFFQNIDENAFLEPILNMLQSYNRTKYT